MKEQLRRLLWAFTITALMATVAGCGGRVESDGTDVESTALALSSSGGGVYPLQATEIGHRWVYLATGQHVLETRDCAAGTDSVLHLTDEHGSQVGMNDDGGAGRHSKLRYAAGSTGWRRVFLRSFSGRSAGECSLFVDEEDYGRYPTGGTRQSMSGLRALEVLETVVNGEGPHTIMVLNGNNLAQVSMQGGIGGAARLTMEASYGGSMKVQVGGFGLVNLVRNDLLPGHDPDDDGLGSELEADIGTCSTAYETVNGFNCGWLKDARDTDSDGLSDAWEVFGVRGSKHQYLPLWGANPRHKDLFIEVDFMQRWAGESDVMMTPEAAREIAAIYAGEIGDPSVEERNHIARTLKNPDGEPGIALHFDTGIDPVLPQDEGLYGDWGGHGVVPHQHGKGAESSYGWQHHMHAARRGVFRYFLGFNKNSASQCAPRSFHCAIPLLNPRVSAHELGHNLGLAHSGPEHHGRIDANCKPHHQSIMNYAFQNEDGYGFSSGLGLKTLDNTRLEERDLSLANDAMLHTLADLYGYNVDFTQRWVDWNRDGEFQTTPTTAYINSLAGSACEFTRYNKTKIQVVSDRDPALVRVDGTIYSFYATSAGAIGYSYTNDAADCPAAGFGCNGMTWNSGLAISGSADALDAIRVGELGSARVLLATVDGNGTLEARWFLPTNGFLQELSSTTLSTQDVQGSAALARQPDGTVVVAFTVDRQLYTRRLDGDGTWSPRTLAVSDGVALPKTALDAPSPALAWASVPANGAQSTQDYVPGLYLTFSRGDGYLIMYRYEDSSGEWTLISPWASGGHGPKSRGRPSMAFIPEDPATGRAPRVYIHYRSSSTGPLSRSVSYARGSGAAAEHVIGLDAPFDNDWFVPAGHDVLFEPGIDSNLRLLAAMPGAPMQFRPLADGRGARRMVNWNDWEPLGSELCLSTVKTGDSNEISCHAWKWGDDSLTSHVRVDSAPGMCLQKTYSHWSNGNPMRLWDCRANVNSFKTWKWHRPSGRISAPSQPEKCWHKQRADWQSGQAVHLWDCAAGDDAQKQWDFEANTGLIRARHNPSMCIVKAVDSDLNGTSIVLEPCNTRSSESKTWSFF